MNPRDDFRPTLAVDFNGVIHDHRDRDGNRRELAADSPAVFGAIDWVIRMTERFDVAVTSARFAGTGGEPRDAMAAARRWLVARGVPAGWVTLDPDRSGRIYLTGSKVPSLVSLDDRAIRFDGNFPAAETLAAYRPWNAR